MKIASQEYPKLESMWEYHEPEVRRFKIEDQLAKFTKTELEQLEIFTWAASVFDPKKIKNLAIAYEIHEIVESFLGHEVIGEGFRVVAE